MVSHGGEIYMFTQVLLDEPFFILQLEGNIKRNLAFPRGVKSIINISSCGPFIYAVDIFGSLYEYDPITNVWQSCRSTSFQVKNRQRFTLYSASCIFPN